MDFIKYKSKVENRNTERYPQKHVGLHSSYREMFYVILIVKCGRDFTFKNCKIKTVNMHQFQVTINFMLSGKEFNKITPFKGH